MAQIPTSNISLQAIQAEVDHSTTTNISLKDQSANAANTTHTSTISGYTSPGGGLTGAPYGMGEFGGFINLSLDGWPTGSGLNTVPDQGWGTASHFSASFVEVGCNYGQFHDTSNDRIRHRWTTFTSAAASVFSYGDQDYTGLDNAQFQAKADYSTVATSGGTSATFQNRASYSPASGTWTNTSTSSYSPIWQWTISISSGNAGTAYLSSYNNGYIYFYNRAILNSVTYPSTADGYGGNQYYRSPGHILQLQATRGTQQGPGGGGV